MYYKLTSISIIMAVTLSRGCSLAPLNRALWGGGEIIPTPSLEPSAGVKSLMKQEFLLFIFLEEKRKTL